MKKAGIVSIAVLLSVCIPLAAWSADFDGTKPILCSVITVIECTPTVDRTVSPESIGMPQFFVIDAVKKKAWPATEKDGTRTSEIKRVERLGGKLILQGADDSADRKRGAVSWTATITEATGKVILTAAGEQVAFVVFGACLPR